jgi:hypothetical protein
MCFAERTKEGKEGKEGRTKVFIAGAPMVLIRFVAIERITTSMRSEIICAALLWWL